MLALAGVFQALCAPFSPQPRSGEQEVLAPAGESPSFNSKSATVGEFTPWE